MTYFACEHSTGEQRRKRSSQLADLSPQERHAEPWCIENGLANKRIPISRDPLSRPPP